VGICNKWSQSQFLRLKKLGLKFREGLTYGPEIFNVTDDALQWVAGAAWLLIGGFN